MKVCIYVQCLYVCRRVTSLLCILSLTEHIHICIRTCVGDREMANVWIRIWDDASNSYKELIKRGYDYTEL